MYPDRAPYCPRLPLRAITYIEHPSLRWLMVYSILRLAACIALRSTKGVTLSKGCPAPNLDPNVYQVHTIYSKQGPIEQTPPESKGPITRALRKALRHCGITDESVCIFIGACKEKPHARRAWTVWGTSVVFGKNL